MAGIEQMKLEVFQIPFVGIGAFCREDVVVLAPHDERRWLVLTEISLPFRITRGIAAVIVEKL